MKSSYGDPAESGAHKNIARAVMLLDALAVAGSTGMRQTDLAHTTGLQKSVVHRALAGLVAHGLAVHNETSALFHLGDRVLAWMQQARERFALADRVTPHLKALTGDLLDTVYFSVIRGDEAVCYSREEGSFPIRTLSLEVGAVRPLGVGSGSLAIFAFLPEEDRERIIAEHTAERSAYGIDDETLRRNVRLTRDAGYALHKGLFAEGMMGVGFPVFNSAGACVGALSTAAITERLTGDRQTRIVKRMQDEAEAVQKMLGQLLDQI